MGEAKKADVTGKDDAPATAKSPAKKAAAKKAEKGG